jgi:DNA adenine methylase
MGSRIRTNLNFFGYIGSKTRISKKLISLFPEHKIYVEPFGGAASVLLNKPPVKIEVINDVSDDIVNLFAVVSSQDTFEEFVKLISRLAYSRSIYKKAAKMLQQPFDFDLFNPDIKRAVVYFYFKNTAISGDGSFSSTRTKPSQQRYFNKLKKLPKIHERLQNVIIEHLDFEECIYKYDTPDTLFFIDPPYLGSEHYYDGNFSLDDHKRLLRVLKDIKGKFVLTTYYNELYANELRNFYYVTIETGIHATVKRSEQRAKGLEYVYMNFEPHSELFAEHKCVNDKNASEK